MYGGGGGKGKDAIFLAAPGRGLQGLNGITLWYYNSRKQILRQDYQRGLDEFLT